MENFDLTFLREDQIFGSNRLKIFKKYGTNAAITDFAILLGGGVPLDYYTCEGKNLENRAGWWWTKSPGDNNFVQIVSVDETITIERSCSRYVGVRPSIEYSFVSSYCTKKRINKFGLLEVEFGEYPQTIVDEKLSCELENVYNNGCLLYTGKEFTTDSDVYEDDGYVVLDSDFKARTYAEYEYNENKYIRFVDTSCFGGEVLSDGKMLEKNVPYWIKVEPIIWLVDEKANIALSKKILFSGVQFENSRAYDGNFEKTNIKLFMDEYFAKDIFLHSLILEEELDGILEDILEEELNKENNGSKLILRK